MYTLLKIKQELTVSINKALSREIVKVADFNYPPSKEMGDISLPLFKISQEMKLPPNEIGSLIMSNLKENETIASMKVAGSYINFFLKRSFLTEKVLHEIKSLGKKYGYLQVKKKEKIILEFSSINTHKEYHVGHLRNLCYGDSITKILNARGHKAKPISYVNDFGIHVAKTLWNFADYTKSKDINSLSDEEKGYLLGKIYTDASQKEKDDPMAKQMIGGFMKKIEERDTEEYTLWKKTREWSIKHFAAVYKEMGVEFADILYENEFVDRGREIVDELVKKNIFKKDNGAIIADLREYGLDVLVCVRSNNTSTYAVADFALAEEKAKRFSPDKSIYIIDVRQELYLKQLFKILELKGHKKELIHLVYDFVKLPSGMMSSRTGNIITYNELRKMVLERASLEIKKRHEDWNDEKIAKIAHAIGFGAIKFEMLKVSARNVITFDIEKALSFDGFTSSYIQYAYARIAGIFEKNADQKINFKELDGDDLTLDSEIELVKMLSRWPETVERAGDNFDPSEIAKYLYDLAGLLNDYYHQVPIIASEKKIKKSRLSLLAAVARTIENGLELLGIKITNEM